MNKQSSELKQKRYFSNKVQCSDGYKFDSDKEHSFYHDYIKHCGYKFKVHPTINLLPKFAIGGMNMGGMSYTPDFIIYDMGKMKHVYDVKTSVSPKATDSAAKNRFKRFAFENNMPVEVVVPRTHDFKMTILGLTKSFEPQIFTNVDYDIHDYIGQ